jgi:hypothetical protein
MRTRPGRPRLDPDDPSVAVCVALPSKQYDVLYTAATAARVTVPALIRRSLTEKKYTNSDRRRPRR